MRLIELIPHLVDFGQKATDMPEKNSAIPPALPVELLRP
jgi:hypothetical protein